VEVEGVTEEENVREVEGESLWLAIVATEMMPPSRRSLMTFQGQAWTSLQQIPSPQGSSPALPGHSKTMRRKRRRGAEAWALPDSSLEDLFCFSQQTEAPKGVFVWLM
jgi:hypothetical protein